MRRSFYLTFLIAVSVLVFCPYAIATNSITLTSFFPAPIGAYDRLRLIPHTDLTGTCDNGSLYYKNSDNTFQVCVDNYWGPLSSYWWTFTQAAGFDPTAPTAIVDQYRFSITDLSTLKPFTGIGTSNPKSPVHIAVNSPGKPSALTIENLYDGSGISECISFRGTKEASASTVSYVTLTAIHNPNSMSKPLLYFSLFDGTGTGLKNQFSFYTPGFLGANSFLPRAIADFPGNAAGATANNLPYLMVSSNAAELNNGNVFTVISTARVGINQPNPTNQLEVAGKIKASGLILTSDAALKKNITPITNALNKISQLKGVYFKWNDSAKQTDQQRHIGILAQNAKDVFPETVYDATDTESVDYPSLIAPLIEAVKELKQKNKVLNQQFRDQSLQLNTQEQKIKSLENAFPAQKLTLKSRGDQ